MQPDPQYYLYNWPVKRTSFSALPNKCKMCLKSNLPTNDMHARNEAYDNVPQILNFQCEDWRFLLFFFCTNNFTYGFTFKWWILKSWAAFILYLYFINFCTLKEVYCVSPYSAKHHLGEIVMRYHVGTFCSTSQTSNRASWSGGAGKRLSAISYQLPFCVYMPCPCLFFWSQ
jgi:hypothetical protein